MACPLTNDANHTKHVFSIVCDAKSVAQQKLRGSASTVARFRLGGGRARAGRMPLLPALCHVKIAFFGYHLHLDFEFASPSIQSRYHAGFTLCFPALDSGKILGMAVREKTIYQSKDVATSLQECARRTTFEEGYSWHSQI